MRLTSFVFAAIAAGIALTLSLPATGTVVSLRNGTMVYVPERHALRCVFFGVDNVSGSYSIDYGAPAWSAEYDSKFDELTLGKRFRFGKDQWTSLDASCPLTIGKTEVKPGLYYCAMERTKKGDFALVLLDSTEIRKSRLDPFASAQTKGGVAIPLDHSSGQDASARLSITIEKDAQNEKQQTLTISFGPHRLTALVKARV